MSYRANFPAWIKVNDDTKQLFIGQCSFYLHEEGIWHCVRGDDGEQLYRLQVFVEGVETPESLFGGKFLAEDVQDFLEYHWDLHLSRITGHELVQYINERIIEEVVK